MVIIAHESVRIAHFSNLSAKVVIFGQTTKPPAVNTHFLSKIKPTLKKCNFRPPSQSQPHIPLNAATGGDLSINCGGSV